jgi:hypothetical protein
MAVEIPANIGEVTPAFLSEVLGASVTGVESQQIGIGIGVSSALYRVRLTGEGCPETVVVKLPALDEAAVFTSTVLRMYIREVRFFHELADRSPIRVPHAYFAEVDEETSRFIVVMEDMGSMRIVDQLVGMHLADAERAVDELAAWHATWWNQADDFAAAGLTVRLGDPIYPAILPMVFGEGWAKVTETMELPQSIHAVGGERFSSAIAGMLASLDRAPTTVTHGDYRADNILFGDDGEVGLLDFQLIGTGSGAYDLAYFITQSLDASVAADHEKALFDRWLDGLRSRGVPDADLGRMWEDYRTAALFCLVYPVVASRGMDLTDQRQYDLVACMSSRLGRAIEQLDLATLL